MSHNKDSHKEEREMLEKIQKMLENSQSKGSSQPKSSTKDYILLAVLVVLVIVSGIQTSKLSNIQVKGVNAANDAGSSAPSQQLPSNLQNLPSQVGGC